MGGTKITPKTARDARELHMGQPQQFHLHTPKIHVLEVADVHFHHDSAVLLPRGLSVVARVFQFVGDNPAKLMFIAGHTDTTGAADYNVSLSELRGKDVGCVVAGDKEGWVKIALTKHKVEDYQLILTWVSLNWGWDCDPGDVTDHQNPQTTQATVNFQKKYNTEFSASIPDSGVVESDTWGAFYDLYEKDLKEIMGVDDAGLAAARAKVHYVDDKRKTVGCGENFPIDAPRKDNYLSSTNRRVEILFFDPDADEKPKLDCHPDEKKCRPKLCEIYGGKLFRFAHVHGVHLESPDASYFVPEAEEVQLSYTISGPIDEVTKVHFLVASKKDPSKIILDRILDGPYLPEGIVNWNGDATDPGFKGWITLASSPYTVQVMLEITGGSKAYSNREIIELTIDSIQVRVDDPAAIALPDSDKDPIAKLKASLQADAKKGLLIYNSPIFKIKEEEMNNDASFVQYRNAWNQGIPVPVYSTIMLKGKDDTPKSNPKATLGTKLLWDVGLLSDADFSAGLQTRGDHLTARTFIEKVSEYKKDESEPKGRTAHKHFGGIRAQVADRAADEKQWRQLHGTWALSDPANRKWSGYTICGPVDTVDADSAVFFVPGRMAGDAHLLRVYVDLDGSIDSTDDAKLTALPASQASNPLIITSTREVNIVGSYQIGSNALNLPNLQTEYTKAAMRMLPGAGVAAQRIEAQWKTNYSTIITKMKGESDFMKKAALDDPGLYPVRYKSYEDYWDALQAEKGVFGKAWNRVRRFFGAHSKEEYKNECDNYAYRVYTRVVRLVIPTLADKGITLIKFGAEGEHNIKGDSVTIGIAPAMSGYTTRTAAIFFLFKQVDDTETLVHEIGHLLFLAHAPGHWLKGHNPDGYQENAHDKSEWCVMSYKHVSKTPCGLCMLKLSGWDYLKMNKDASVV